MAPPVPPIPTYTGPPKKVAITQSPARTNAIRDFYDQIHQSMQTIPRQLQPTPIPGSSGYQGPSHPGPGGGSALLDAIMRRYQALQQGAYAQQQAASPRFVPPLGHAGLRNAPYDPTLTDPMTGEPISQSAQIADYYKANVMGSLGNTGGPPDVSLLGTDIPTAFQNAVTGSPLVQQVVQQAAINSGHIPPQQPWPAPVPGQMPPPAGVNPYLPLGPTNISPGAPGTNTAPPGSGSVYQPQYRPPQTYGQQY